MVRTHSFYCPIRRVLLPQRQNQFWQEIYATGGGINAGLDAVPLILCTDCKSRQVVRRTSKQPWSEGNMFYCCPSRKNGAGCPFFYWEEDNIEFLRKDAKGGSSASTGNNIGQRIRDDAPGLGKGIETNLKNVCASYERYAESKMLSLMNENERLKNDRALIVIGKQVVSLFKVICVVSVCNLFVLSLMLFVHLIKN